MASLKFVLMTAGSDVPFRVGAGVAWSCDDDVLLEGAGGTFDDETTVLFFTTRMIECIALVQLHSN